jgi:hypothetical protein
MTFIMKPARNSNDVNSNMTGPDDSKRLASEIESLQTSQRKIAAAGAVV